MTQLELLDSARHKLRLAHYHAAALVRVLEQHPTEDIDDPRRVAMEAHLEGLAYTGTAAAENTLRSIDLEAMSDQMPIQQMLRTVKADGRRDEERDITMHRHALGEILGVDSSVAKAVREMRRRWRFGDVAVVEMDRPGGLRVAVTGEDRTCLVVILERDRLLRVRLVEDLVEQVSVLGMEVVLEQAAVALEPRPRDDAVAVASEPERPLGLAPLVLAQPPRNVTDVPGRPRPEQPPLLEGELLHPFDDLRRESHV